MLKGCITRQKDGLHIKLVYYTLKGCITHQKGALHIKMVYYKSKGALYVKWMYYKSVWCIICQKGVLYRNRENRLKKIIMPLVRRTLLRLFHPGYCFIGSKSIHNRLVAN